MKKKRERELVEEGKEWEKEIEKLQNQLKKAVADYHNLEKRIKKEVFLLRKDTLARLIDKLLPVLDDLERAETHLKNKGLRMIISRFRQVLASEGVKEIKSEGEEFDPTTMDCVALVAGPKNRVVETLEKGYSLNGELIRPAKVKVGQEKEDK